MSRFVIVAETGCDITAAQAQEMGIYLAPMHVSMKGQTSDDGSFPSEDIVDCYAQTGELPKTSGCTPGDFSALFEQVHTEHPDKHIIHLAYSAVTTCSYQSAIIAADGADYVTSVDTCHVSAGQGAVVRLLKEWLDANPDAALEEAVACAKDLSARMKMWFAPDTLEFLRAGGRVSNAAFLLGQVLKIHPRIELIEGKLVATKKYRGKMQQVAVKLLNEFVAEQQLDMSRLWLIHAPGLAEQTCAAVEAAARELGFEKIEWVKTGCVITTHGGPGAFGAVALAKK